MSTRCVFFLLFAVCPVIPLYAEEPPTRLEEASADNIAPPPSPPPQGPPPGMGIGMGMGMGMGPGGGPPGYWATWYPSRPVSGSNDDLGLIRQQANIGAPIWVEDGRRLMLNASVRNTSFFTDVLLPDSGRPFPNELWNISLGVNYIHQFENGWTGSLGLNFGSASDKPFHSIEEVQLGALGFVRIPVKNDRDAWMFSVFYSPTSNFNFPIPGIAYSWNPSPAFSMNIGLPFFLTWKPNEDWTLNLSYIPVTNVNARVTYRVAERIFTYGGFEWLYEAYFLADREDRNDRFIAFEKRLITGLRWDLASKASLDINGGYAFDREYGIGQNQIGNLSDRVTISNGVFLGAQFRVRY
jgi:hypothetical protein